MNMQELLTGSGVKTTTHALGVIMVTIHHAMGLSAQDASGSSDPYIVLAYAKFGKPIYSTRIIGKELNPVFEETAFMLLSLDEVEAKEKLSVMLWDSGLSPD
jgi:Ca2+-dependent lipid-binding protein